MGKKFKAFFDKQDTLEKRMFYAVNFVGVVTSVLSAVFTYFENISIIASIAALACSFIFVFISFIAYKTDKHDVCYFVTTLVISVIIFPVLYFICGGLYSGMPLYFISALLLCSLNQDLGYRAISLFFAFISFVGVFVLDELYPELVSRLSDSDARFDIVQTYAIVGFSTMLVMLVVIKTYSDERRKLAELNAQLTELSQKDPLTGLYNRRALYDYIDSPEAQKDIKLYVAMYDIDDFKFINDKYGYQFGDEVLKKLGGIFLDNVKEILGERAARYGGEEFVYIISAESYAEAARRADLIRSELASTVWEDHRGLSVTLSGGLAQYDNNDGMGIEQALKLADEYLYIAKAEGKNRIKRVGSGIIINSMVFRK